MTCTLSVDQHFALARLQRFLRRRSAVETDPQAGEKPYEAWLVHALDHTIVSYYRLACQLGVGHAADALLRCYHEAHEAGSLCLAAPAAA